MNDDEIRQTVAEQIQASGNGAPSTVHYETAEGMSATFGEGRQR